MRIETIVCGQSNVYLLHGNQTAVLIDTGTDKYKDKVLERCRKTNVRLILLTHGHFDHCQNAAYLAGQLKCPVGIAQDRRRGNLLWAWKKNKEAEIDVKIKAL